MRSIGRNPETGERCGGSMYVLLSVFLTLLFLVLVFLACSLRMFVLFNEINRAFGMNGADVVTKIRVDHFQSMTETNPDSIDTAVALPSGADYMSGLIEEFVNGLAGSLSCVPEGTRDRVIVKEGVNGRNAFTLTDFRIDYAESVGAIRARLHIPVFFNGFLLGEYSRDLEYSFALSYKENST